MLDQEPVKVCPECGGEYRPEIERCADCGVPLVHPEEIAARDARELRASPALVAVFRGPIALARALAADLDGKGISYRIDRKLARAEGQLTVLVRRMDVAVAEALAEAFHQDGEPAVLPLRREAPSFKVCPECGGEYRLDIERCADCEVVLVYPSEAPSVEDEEEEVAEEEPLVGDEGIWVVGPVYALPASDDLVCVCCRYRQFIPKVSRALDEAAIHHRFEPAPFAPSKAQVVCVYVQPADGDAAAAVDAALWKVDLDDPDLRTELAVCPACSAPRAPSTMVCSICGLRLGFEPDFVDDRLCAHCGAVVGVAVPRCPSCAAVLQAG